MDPQHRDRGTSFSIRYKFLVVTTLLLVVCVGAYFLLATHVFKRDKTELVFDYSRSSVSNISSDLESLFQSVNDRLTLIASFYGRAEQAAVLRHLLQNQQDIVYMGVSPQFKTTKKLYTSNTYQKTYAISDDELSQAISEQALQQIRVKGQWIWNASTSSGAPLIGYGRNVSQENEQDGRIIRQFAMVSLIKADRILKALESGHFAEAFVLDSQGDILAHPNKELQMAKASFREDKLFQLALDQKVKLQVVNFEEGSDRYLGAIAKAFQGQIYVVSQVSEAKAFEAVNRLLYRSSIFALIVITAAFIVAILFSRTLTRPIEKLMGGMKKVAKGQLDTQIDVGSRDEIAILANSFNRMIVDLKASREELEEVNRGLETKVKERTHELEIQNQAVKRAQEALLRTTRLATVGEIAGQAAHEVLNPLTSMVSRLQRVKERVVSKSEQETQLLEEIRSAWDQDFQNGGFEGLVSQWQKPSEMDSSKTLWQEDLTNLTEIRNNLRSEIQQLSEDMDFILREGQRINRIVQSMRSMNTVKAELRDHSLVDLIKDVINVMKDLADQDSIELKMAPDVDPVWVRVDQDEFIQAGTNLLRNAIQAVKVKLHEDSGFVGRIVVSTSVDDGRVKIHIEDNGCGISSENQKKLFETQFTTKSLEEGTGLGLGISRRFLRAFDGDIYLDHSQEGEGSQFVMELPRYDVESKRTSA